jgi:ribulose-5-phosphate 4-epimerase/fuculose-1-phosphate aldolase
MIIRADAPRPNESPIEAERRQRKQKLAAAYRLFARFGFDEGVAGHITVRDPEHPNRFWVNPLGRYFGKMRPDDLVCVDHDGTIVSGQGPINRAAFAIHSEVHKARPDVAAAAHAHSPSGKAFSSLHTLLAPLTQDACAFFEDHALFDDYTGVVSQTDEGHRIAEALGTKKAVILVNHGLLTVGGTIEEAAWWFITMERSCGAELAARAAGEPKPIPNAVARHTRDQIGNSMVGWLSFQPLYERIVAEQPDLLEG